MNIQWFSGFFWGCHGLNHTVIGLWDITLNHNMAGKVSFTAIKLTLNLLN
jgi:hypothetical protein